MAPVVVLRAAAVTHQQHVALTRVADAQSKVRRGGVCARGVKACLLGRERRHRLERRRQGCAWCRCRRCACRIRPRIVRGRVFGCNRRLIVRVRIGAGRGARWRRIEMHARGSTHGVRHGSRCACHGAWARAVHRDEETSPRARELRTQALHGLHGASTLHLRAPWPRLPTTTQCRRRRGVVSAPNARFEGATCRHAFRGPTHELGAFGAVAPLRKASRTAFHLASTRPQRLGTPREVTEPDA